MTEELVALLLEKKMTVTTAESCTGGLIAATLISVPGVSACLNETLVTYANASKHKRLGVSEETLATYGAVSEQTAREMALGALAFADADISIVSTGIAGPDGGTKEKPVGLVYIGIGCRAQNKAYVSRHVFSGDRAAVRAQAVETAIANAVEVVKGV
ncbi:MAG: nicotinamide-nucleotide amidohydrolase family protein [Lachnospiraceae bacterium]|nr:nicotinamide-nucleotide amidohydrolase family protein [Lachnospiraceae bacterium]